MNVFDINGNALEKEKIRVCAFNVGNFANGQSGTALGTDELYNKFINTFRKCNADIYMFCEWDVNWNSEEKSEDVLGFLKPYHSTYCKNITDGYVAQMIYSDFAFKSEYHEDYTSEPQRYFIDDVIQINGKDIHLIATHLTIYTKEQAIAQIQQLLNYISNNNIEYYIIGGDMNHGIHTQDDLPQTNEERIAITLEEVGMFESLGGKSVQGSGWGLKDINYLFNTILHRGYSPIDGTTNGIAALDNIIVSPGIRISNVEMIITDASDHDALCADLIIL